MTLEFNEINGWTKENSKNCEIISYKTDIRFVRVSNKDNQILEKIRFVEHPDVSPKLRVFYMRFKINNAFGEVSEVDETESTHNVIYEFTQVIDKSEMYNLLKSI